MNKKKVMALFLGLAMTFTSVPAVVQAEVQETEAKIVNLKTEGMVEPLGLDEEKPSFSWQMQSDAIGAAQKSYQIVVMDETETVVWDSGVVESNISHDIPYEGEDLQPTTKYSWKVTVTDEQGNTLESEPASFETAFMDTTRESWDGAQMIGATDLSLDAASQCIFNISAWVQIPEGSSSASFILGADDFRLENAVFNTESIQLPRTYANDGPLGYTGDQVGGYFVRWSEDLSGEDYYTEESDERASWRMAVMPTEPMVAATFNQELIEREGELLGEDGLWANESSLFAPGLNLHRTVYCARNHEYYSEDSMLSALCGNALCIGLKTKGTQAEPKHFAFNHQESNRSGLSTFIKEQAARENELRSFQMVMSRNNAAGVMTAFNRAGTSFVGAYKPLLVGIARDEWNYLGWFNTDMINGADYMNWRDVTAGGGGNCLTTSAYDTSEIGNMASSKSAIEKDQSFQEMMKFNLKFWVYQLAQCNAMNGISSTTEIQYVVTISSNEDETKMEILCNFYGDDQKVLQCDRVQKMNMVMPDYAAKPTERADVIVCSFFYSYNAGTG